MNFIKFLEKKISVWVLVNIIVIFFFVTILFGWSVRHIMIGGDRLKHIEELVINLASAPTNVIKIFRGQDFDFSLENRFDQKKGLIYHDENFDKKNVNYFLLLSRYDGDKNKSVVEIIDIKNNKIIHTYKPDIDKINSISKIDRKIANLERDHDLSRYRIIHPLLLKSGDLVFNAIYTPMIKIDKCSNLIWIIDKIFHHTNEIDGDGNIWSPGTKYPSRFEKLEKNFKDDVIFKISPDGKVLLERSIIEILINNKLEKLIGNYSGDDPIHLNDVQPALDDSPFWKKGDLFLSMRHISTIMLYRPSTDKVIWYKQSGWNYQHDVDIINEHQILVFDNNVKWHKKTSNELKLIKYDFKNKNISEDYKNLLNDNDVKTKGEGLQETVDEDIFIEENNYARLIFGDKLGNIKWEYINRAKNGNLYRLNWSSILKKDDFDETIKILKNSNCK